MVYLLTFTGGFLAFLSPCVLPLIPAYVAYFATGEAAPQRTWRNALGFFLGLLLVLISLGLFAGGLGVWLGRRPIEVVGGLLLIFFGLHYTGALQIPALRRIRGRDLDMQRLQTLRFPWAVAFGMVFALCWTPCVGPLLGAALLTAARMGGVLEGALVLFSFALGIGLPFFLAALFLDRLKGAFAFVKRHHTAISRVSGTLLILIGLIMLLGFFRVLTHGLT